MKRFTVIIVPNDVSPVRRFGVEVRLLRRAAGACAVVALALAAFAVDYVRLRHDAPELARLRAVAETQRETLAAHAAAQKTLASELARLHELERRVRVIANLPQSSLEQVRVRQAPHEGVGGGGERPDDATPPIGSPIPGATAFESADGESAPLGTPLDAATTPAAPLPEPATPVSDATDPATSEALLAASSSLGERARELVSALEDLTAGLRGRIERLAATPVIWPANGWLTSRFGFRLSPFTGRRDFHAGIDIAADFGTPIVSPAAGRVAFAGRRGALGTAVVIDHGYGVRTMYGHLKEARVTAGTRVVRGATIATIGNSGLSTGPHLHYAVEVGGKTVDPLDYIIE